MAKNTLTFGEVITIGSLTTKATDTISTYQTAEAEKPCTCSSLLELNGGTYGADETIGEIVLNPGDSIEVGPSDTNTTSNLLILGTSSNKVTELSRYNSKYTNTSDSIERVKLGVYYHYASDSTANRHTYVISRSYPYYTSIGDGFALLAGDKFTITTKSEIALLDLNGDEIAHLYHAGESYTATSDTFPCYLAAKTSGKSLSYTILPAEERREYSTEYTGESGILQLTRENKGKLHIYGDAGLGYMQMVEAKNGELLWCLNMDGLDKVKIVSESKVTGCIVNEF